MNIFQLKRRNFQNYYLFILIATIVGSFFILYKAKHVKSKASDIKYEFLDGELEHDIIEDTKNRIINDVTYAPVFKKHYQWFYGDKKNEDTKPRNINKSDYHYIWLTADEQITKDQLFPTGKDVDLILHALATAKIVHVDVLDIGEYESGTADKWIIALEGGQKAVVKLVWGEKGEMKRGGLCNYGFEMAWSEIAAFNLHRLLDFRNTPYVTGRKINIITEVLPVASPQVVRQIQRGVGNDTCVTGKCFYCKSFHKVCSSDGIVEASVAYWVPKHLQLYTWPPKYMPFSTPRMEVWSKFQFNNKSYCHKVRKEIHPYEKEQYYLDLFDFAVLDTLMYHFDSKHYTLQDESSADGLTVRLDHGRAFCAHDRDDEHIMLAPVTQCCTLRRSTYEKLSKFQTTSLLSQKLNGENNKDPIAPLLDTHWYRAIERRLKLIFSMIMKCAKANGGLENVLV